MIYNDTHHCEYSVSGRPRLQSTEHPNIPAEKFHRPIWRSCSTEFFTAKLRVKNLPIRTARPAFLRQRLYSNLSSAVTTKRSAFFVALPTYCRSLATETHLQIFQERVQLAPHRGCYLQHSKFMPKLRIQQFKLQTVTLTSDATTIGTF